MKKSLPPSLKHCLASGVPAHDLTIREEVIIFEIDSVDRSIIAVQLAKYPLKALETLNETITEEAHRAGIKRLSTPAKVGDLVAVPIDGGLYRGCVCGLSGEFYSVYQLDFGAVCEVPRGHLFPLDKKFLPHPQVGLRCRLKPHQSHIAYHEEPFVVSRLRSVGLDNYGLDLYEFELESTKPHVDEIPATSVPQGPSKDKDCVSRIDDYDLAGEESRAPVANAADSIPTKAETCASASETGSRPGVISGISSRSPRESSAAFTRARISSTRWSDAVVQALHPVGPNGEVRVMVQLTHNKKVVDSIFSELFMEKLPELSVSPIDGTARMGVTYGQLNGVYGAKVGGQWMRVWRNQSYCSPSSEDILVDVVDYGVRVMLKQHQIFICEKDLLTLPAASVAVSWPANAIFTVQLGDVVIVKATGESSTNDGGFVPVDVYLEWRA